MQRQKVNGKRPCWIKTFTALWMAQLIYFLQGLKSLIYIDSTPFTDEREKRPWMSHWPLGKRTLWSCRTDLGHFLRLGLNCASTRFYVKTSGLCVFQSEPTFFVLNSRKVKTLTPMTTNKLLTPYLSVHVRDLKRYIKLIAKAWICLHGHKHWRQEDVR